MKTEQNKVTWKLHNSSKFHMGSSIALLLFLNYLLIGEAKGRTTFTFVNKCGFTVWPGILSNAGHSPLTSTGFELPRGASGSVQAPAGWSGRFWGRTGCAFDASGHGSCATGDCDTGGVECSGKGAVPPATLAEFTLNGSGGMDFYDVSLVDGYNLPVLVEGGGGRCGATGCTADLNRRCPTELRVGEGDSAACRSACEAFRRPEFCCSGAFGSPTACRPTSYSQVFKSACPKSYSYAYDDASSTFTCAAAGEYTVTFCPDSTPRQKAARDSTPASPKTPDGGLMLENDAWLANLATDSAATLKSMATSPPIVLTLVFFSASLPFLFTE